jgi:phenylacetate 2-hydroxylase
MADKSVYGADAEQFRPERWQEDGLLVPPPYHFAFGAGARQCTAVNFSNRVLYAIFLRLIVAFVIEPSNEMPANTHYIDYKKDPAAANAVPADFKVKLTPRDGQFLERRFGRSEELSMSSEYSEPLKR